MTSTFDFLYDTYYDDYEKINLSNTTKIPSNSLVLGVYCRIVKKSKSSHCIKILKKDVTNNEMSLIEKANLLKLLKTCKKYYKIYVEIISNTLVPSTCLHLNDPSKRYLVNSNIGIILFPDEFIFFDNVNIVYK